MTAIVESTRYILLGRGTVSVGQYGYSLGASLVLLLIGVFAYQRSARTFVDTV
jgi:lipopolysaccharide transport system permease protein